MPEVSSLGSSLSDEEIGSGADDDAFQGDTWIEELECALLADCDQATLKKMSEGKRIPANLRPDYWRALLALNDAGKVKLTGEYDLENQLEIRSDCELLVEDISTNLAPEPLNDADKLRLRSDFESTLTTYVKARPELNYIPGNGWTDILRVLYHLNLSDTLLYQMFYRIIDRYIPKDLSYRPPQQPQQDNAQDKVLPKSSEPTQSSSPLPKLPESEKQTANATEEANQISTNAEGSATSSKPQEKGLTTSQSSQTTSYSKIPDKKDPERSIQAYHLLRLLIQYHDPELCSILDSKKVIPNLYVKDWFSSLFSRSCSPDLALLIWDTHFRMADPFLIFFAAIVMVVNASDELKKKHMTQEDMLSVLKIMPSKLEEDDIEDLYYLVSNHYTNSTPRSIRSYSHLFFMDTFGNTYLGNDSPEDGQPMVDLKSTLLTSSLDLSQYLCLPIVPAEIFAIDTAQLRSSPTQSSSSLRYFLVDCRPAEQYNAGHLTRAFHLDCSLMLREPSSFATAVQALLEIQRQVVASKSSTGGQHLCFIGSGQEEEDQYVNMVVASFLQKYTKYVSIVVGGFDAIHEYVRTKNDLMESFPKYIVDHNEEMCKPCYSRSPDALQRYRRKNITSSSHQASSSSSSTTGGLSPAQMLFASTTSFLRGDKTAASLNKLTSNPQAAAAANLIAQSGASMFDKFTTAFVSKSSVIKDRLVETLNTTAIPAATSLSHGASTSRGHVSSHDKLGRRYTGSNIKCAVDDKEDDLSINRGLGQRNGDDAIGEPVQEIQIDTWQTQAKIKAFYKCSQIKGYAKYPGYIALSNNHLWILREIPHNKGFATIAAKRPLDMIVQITSKRRQPDLIIFRYGCANNNQLNNNSQQQQQQQQGSSEGFEATKAAASSSQSEEEEKEREKQEDTQQPQQQQPEKQKSLPSIVASDILHIPQAFEVIRLIKHEIVRIMDENSRNASNSASISRPPEPSEQSTVTSEQSELLKQQHYEHQPEPKLEAQQEEKKAEEPTDMDKPVQEEEPAMAASAAQLEEQHNK